MNAASSYGTPISKAHAASKEDEDTGVAGAKTNVHVALYWDDVPTESWTASANTSLFVGEQTARSVPNLSRFALFAPSAYGITINVPDGWELHVDGQPNTDSNTLTLGHFAILREPGASFALRIELVERSRRAFGLRLEGAGTILASLAAHACLFGSFAYFMPSLGADDAGELSRDQILRMRAYLDASAEREKEAALEEAGPKGNEQDSAQGGKAIGEAGLMGKPNVTTKGKWSLAGNATPDKVTFDKTREMRDASESGMVALIGTLSQYASPSIAAPWGSTANGADSSTVNGGLWDMPVGESGGFLGLSDHGNGPGGDGNNVGIGLNQIGTIGTRGTPDGSGMGTCGGDKGCGGVHVGGSHTTRAPRMREGKFETTGSLPREVIQRIVRQNFGRFRLCYENGLRTNPSLQGRVAVNFLIGRDGRVVSSNVNSGATELPDANVQSCVAQSFQGLSFPEPQNGSVKVMYPIVFAAGSES
ncbi:MAG: AgmX/PglI C-terminal domain-containing protein [Polyangiaceae bacterium]|nr:AgmX/PglI C-terminal domain-containing protein [Polyangiaceae bacterium]